VCMLGWLKSQVPVDRCFAASRLGAPVAP